MGRSFRYIPRIAAFRDALQALGTEVNAGNFKAVLDFTEKEGPAEDVKNPLELFSSSFFSEGNKASSNTELKPTIQSILKANESMRVAAKKKNTNEMQKAYQSAVSGLNEYIETVRAVKALGNDLEPIKL